jgi:hypothetical protein
MSRYKSSGSYGHRVIDFGNDIYRVSWVVDRYYPTSRLRHPRGCSRDTDKAGAERFAKRWGIAWPLTGTVSSRRGTSRS